jgi:CMP-N-acetylneuraminic acid synthetase
MTISALLIGRGGSAGLPGKNTTPILGRPLMAYPLIAAKQSHYIDSIYISSDSEKIMSVGESYGATRIQRPPELCTTKALGEDAFRHGYEVIRDAISTQGEKIEFMVLLMANAATITAKLIDSGIEMLRADPDMDSAVTVSRYNMWSPIRARKTNENGYLEPFVPFDAYPEPEKLSCDRDSQGDILFADMGVSVVRPHCLENLKSGLMPQKWMGQKIGAIQSWGGCDVDYEWQIAGVEYWLMQHGFSTADDDDNDE